MIYLYRRRDNGEIVERHFSGVPDDEEKLRRVECEDGVIADRDFMAEANDRPGHKAYHHLWPKKSRAAGLNPNQVAEDGRYADEEARRKHPDHRFDPDTGEMVFSDKKQRRKQLKEIGMTDHDSYAI